MSDERLKTFLAVVRCGSLTSAAKELFISQPAVTLQIHKLEEEYHEALFFRRERGVELTPAGKVLLDCARKIDRIYGEAEEEIRALSGSEVGILRIGATLTIGEYVLPQIIGRYKAEHPQVEILLEVENTRRIVESVAAGVLDCGLVEGPFENGMIRAEKLADDELAFICSPSHRLANSGEIGLDAILQESFILREPGSGTRKVFEDALSKTGTDIGKLKVLMQMGSTQAIKALVAENIGISVLSKRTVAREIEQGTLYCLNVPAVDLHRTFQFVFNKNASPSLVCRHFVRMCREGIR